MSSRSVQDHIEALLTRKVVEQRARGAPSHDVEAASLFESIAITLLLNPRVALYSALLARNALLSAANRELSSLSDLRQTVRDLGNTSLAIKNTKALERAKTALLQMESQQKVDASGHGFKRFDSAVNDFLDKQLAKNVRRPGSTELVRPSAEAAVDLQDSYTSLKEQHTDLLDRLYSLAVGVDNLLSTPLSALLGLSTSSRTRDDIQDIIDSLEADNSASISRDAAVRLISARAALRVVGSPPDVAAPVISSARSLPKGYALTAYSGPKAPTSGSTLPQPWVLPVGAGVTVQVGANTVTAPLFPQTTVDHQNAAYVVGKQIPGLIGFGSNEYLFLKLRLKSSIPPIDWTPEPPVTTTITYVNSNPAIGGGWTFIDGLYEKTFSTLLSGLEPFPTIRSKINTTLGSLGTALEYVLPGTFRIYIRGNPSFVQSIAIAESKSNLFLASTVGAMSFFSNSIHDKLGFYLGQEGVDGSVGETFLTDAFAALFPSVVTVDNTLDDGVILLTALDDTPGAVLTVSGTATAVLGMNGSFNAATDVVLLKGSVLGVDTDPANPIPLMDVGDFVDTPSGTSKAVAITGTNIVLEDALDTFDGDVTVRSALYEAWKALDGPMQAYVEVWVKTKFASNLSKLDAVIAPLAGLPTPAQRNAAIFVIDELENNLNDLVTAISAVSSFLPSDAATDEKATFNGIVQSLLERKFDRAVDFLVKCRLQELFEVDWQSASFSGAMLKSASDLVRTDFQFPNRALGEGLTAKAVVNRTGRAP